MTIWKDTFQNASVSTLSSSQPGCNYKGLSAKRFTEIHFVFQTLFKEIRKDADYGFISFPLLPLVGPLPFYLPTFVPTNEIKTLTLVHLF